MNTTVSTLSKEEREQGRYFMNNTADRAWQRWMRDLMFTCDQLERTLARLAIPTEALLMDRGSHKYIAPEIISEWEAALRDGSGISSVANTANTQLGERSD